MNVIQFFIVGTLAREYGFVASSAADWGLSSATYPMSIMVSGQSIANMPGSAKLKDMVVGRFKFDFILA